MNRVGDKSCISIEIFLNFFKTNVSIRNVSIRLEENLILYTVRNSFDKIYGKLKLSIIIYYYYVEIVIHRVK